MGTTQSKANPKSLVPSNQWRCISSTPNGRTFENAITKELSEMTIVQNVTNSLMEIYLLRKTYKHLYVPKLYDYVILDTNTLQMVQVMVETVSVRLSDEDLGKKLGINGLDSLFLMRKLQEVLLGFEFLYRQFGAFGISSSQIGWTRNEVTKVWLNEHFETNIKTVEGCSEMTMLDDIFRIFNNIIKLPKLIIKNFTKALQMVKTLQNPKLMFNYEELRYHQHSNSQLDLKIMHSPRSNISSKHNIPGSQTQRFNRVREDNHQIQQELKNNNQSEYEKGRRIKTYNTSKNIQENHQRYLRNNATKDFKSPNNVGVFGNNLSETYHSDEANIKSNTSSRVKAIGSNFVATRGKQSHLGLLSPIRKQKEEFDSRNSFDHLKFHKKGVFQKNIKDKGSNQKIPSENNLQDQNKSLQKVKFTFTHQPSKELSVRNTASSINTSINNNLTHNLPKPPLKLQHPINLPTTSLRSSQPIRFDKNIASPTQNMQQHNQVKSHFLTTPPLPQKQDKTTIEKALESICGGESLVFYSQDMKGMSNSCEKWSKKVNLFGSDHIKEMSNSVDVVGLRSGQGLMDSVRQGNKRFPNDNFYLPLINEQQNSMTTNNDCRKSHTFVVDQELEDALEQDLDGLFDNGQIQFGEQNLQILKNELEGMFDD